MLKNKIFILFTIVICLFSFLSVSVYATDNSNNFVFTGYDGNTYVLPPLPPSSLSYSHYLIIKIPDGDSFNFSLLCFNNNLEMSKSSVNDNSISIYTDDKSKGKQFEFIGGNEWSEFSENGYYVYPTSSVFIYSCDDIIQYLDELNNEDSFFYNPPTEESQGILAPIMQETPLEGVLKEIMAILPVILVIIVGLIGLRKALKFLSKVLHRS